jgi:hypothetical protein
VISAEQQFAEKLHAYSLPRGERANTRTKDLNHSGKLDRTKASAAVRATFAKRGTHTVPSELDPPPAEWGPVFDALAKECGLQIKIGEGLAVVRDFAKTLET